MQGILPFSSAIKLPNSQRLHLAGGIPTVRAVASERRVVCLLHLFIYILTSLRILLIMQCVDYVLRVAYNVLSALTISSLDSASLSNAVGNDVLSGLSP